MTRRRLLWLYPAWIVLCALLFIALRGANDPSRRKGRILNNEAGTRAVAILRQRDATRFADYEPVHVAWAPAGEAGSLNRWIVLCDHAKHSGLKEAMVVELRGDDGSLLAIRKPQP